VVFAAVEEGVRVLRFVECLRELGRLFGFFHLSFVSPISFHLNRH
jgi:hypothetical protein